MKPWLASRYLLLNEAKTETILFTTPNHRTPQPRPLVIDICGCNVTTSATIHFGHRSITTSTWMKALMETRPCAFMESSARRIPGVSAERGCRDQTKGGQFHVQHHHGTDRTTSQPPILLQYTQHQMDELTQSKINVGDLSK